MKVHFQHNNFDIEVFEDSAFSQNSDTSTIYYHIYEPDADKDYKPSSQHAVRVYDGEKLVSSAIIMAAAGATSVSEDSTLICNNSLLVRCSNIIVSLSIPQLELIWMTVADPITCFSMHIYQNTIITHGELTVSRIDLNGNILWEFGSGDILLRIDGANCFKMNTNSISLQNFNGDKFQIDYDGNLLTKSDLSINPKRLGKRKWWKFWK